ncbi:ligand-binding sensor domain-containing protein [Flavihumibacter fluvii]|uniref:ligand-binding sensor domain-containing protein n=1 Tax=Flavihumibacter fluvii TaxID=2838157 RepID=UPI001BDE20B6|nr:two-component regulator propeller domain-containing protein [Flavihumibacter fluvii]ULQ53176.1 hypothetical protein KJS93_02440 [Flavihumibacter fluvii]
MRYWLQFILLLYCTCTSYAQQQRYLFSYLGLKDGLQDANIISVQQDEKGFLWIASRNSLQRYDGLRFLNFSHKQNDPASIPDAAISSMALDKKNRLWVSTSKNTVGYLDVNSLVFTPIPIRPVEAEKGRSILTLHPDRDGNILLIFHGGEYITYDEKRREFTSESNPFKLPDGWKLLYTWQDHNRNYWVGTNEGLFKYNPVSKLSSYRGHNTENDPVISEFGELRMVVNAYLDKTNCFWITSWNTGSLLVYSYAINTREKTEWQDKVLRALKNMYFDFYGVTEMKDGSIWFSGNNLFARADVKKKTVQPMQANISGEYNMLYDNVNLLFEDRENNLWIATNKGLLRFNPAAQKFTAVQNKYPGRDTSYTPDVTDFLQTQDGEILVSTWGNNIFAYDSLFNPIPSGFANPRETRDISVWCLTQRQNGDIWQGLQAGVLKIYPAAGKPRRLLPDAIANSTIRQVAEDMNGDMWLGTQRGLLVKWTASSDSFRLVQKFEAVISRIYISADNSVWICTDRNGVFRLNATTGSILSHYSDKGPKGQVLRMNGAADIIQYDDSTMVISGDGLNVLNLHTGKFAYLTKNDGLASTDLTNLVKDKYGYIWMTGTTGIYSFHPKKNKLSSYNSLDGIPTNTFNVASSATLKDGRILFGTNHDFIVFDPAIVTVNDYIPPKVYITGFSLFNQELSVDSVTMPSKLDLKYFEHSFRIQLSTLTYQNTYTIQYKMEGLDRGWTPAGPLNEVSFNFLPPGEYTFKTACMDEKKIFHDITSLQIIIHPPFWKTWWFYSLVALLIGSLFFWLDNERIKRKEALQKMRTDIAVNLQEEVNMALSDINILSEMARIKAEKEPEKSKEFIEQIHSKSQHMMVAMDDMLWSIRPENDNMRKTLERMQEFIEGLNNRNATNIEMWVDRRVQNLELNMKYRYEILHLFKESMTALINSKPEYCRINMSLEKATLLFTMEFNLEKSTLQQLDQQLKRKSIAKSLAAANARIQTQALEKGSALLLEIPLSQDFNV